MRKPKDRLAKVSFDFTNKTVLDIGCNQGGMIFALKDKLRWAVGVDYDYRMINACNIIKREFDVGRTHFFVFDIDKDSHELVHDFLPESKVDIVFLLAVCVWIDKWREIIHFSSIVSDVILFESNGDPDVQDNQVTEVAKYYPNITLVSDKSDDDPVYHGRRLYLATK